MLFNAFIQSFFLYTWYVLFIIILIFTLSYNNAFDDFISFLRSDNFNWYLSLVFEKLFTRSSSEFVCLRRKFIIIKSNTHIHLSNNNNYPGMIIVGSNFREIAVHVTLIGMKVSNRYHPFPFQRPNCIIRRWYYNWYCCSLSCRQVLSESCLPRVYSRAILLSPRQFTPTVIYMVPFLFSFDFSFVFICTRLTYIL